MHTIRKVCTPITFIIFVIVYCRVTSVLGENTQYSVTSILLSWEHSENRFFTISFMTKWIQCKCLVPQQGREHMNIPLHVLSIKNIDILPDLMHV